MDQAQNRLPDLYGEARPSGDDPLQMRVVRRSLLVLRDGHGGLPARRRIRPKLRELLYCSGQILDLESGVPRLLATGPDGEIPAPANRLL